MRQCDKDEEQFENSKGTNSGKSQNAELSQPWLGKLTFHYDLIAEGNDIPH